MQHITYLCLGSNLGNKSRNLERAIEAMPPYVEALLVSSIYETAPWGYTDQPAFLNQIVKAGTDLTPHQLLAEVKWIESKLDRQPTFRYGPRSIDVDILLYDELVLTTEKLTIPHPRLAERAFALVPLAEIAPDLVHPVLKKTIKELLSSIDRSDVRPVSPYLEVKP